jgi:hypothetical protein
MLGVLCVGLAGAGCATDRQSSTATDAAAPKDATPDLMNANRLQGRNRTPGPFDNQGAPGYDPITSPQQGVPMTGFQSMQQRMNRPYMGP